MVSPVHKILTVLQAHVLVELVRCAITPNQQEVALSVILKLVLLIQTAHQILALMVHARLVTMKPLQAKECSAMLMLVLTIMTVNLILA